MSSTLKLAAAAAFAFAAVFPNTAAAQLAHGGSHGGGHPHPHLHLSDRWKECSIQLDQSLTQSAWAQFTREAGLVVYFRPLTDARPMGKGKFELSLLQWKTGIDDADPAWNDTFVHPDSSHVLFEGSGLAFPGLTARVGVTDRTDIGLYVTKSPNANYGFAGAQVQQNFLNDTKRNISAAARLSYVALYGPEDLDFGVLGADLLVSYRKELTSWASVSPYIGAANFIAHSHEKSAVVDLQNETQLGSQMMFGATLQLSAVKLSAEYANAAVKTVSFKVGFAR
jgi:hypothetical protein